MKTITIEYDNNDLVLEYPHGSAEDNAEELKRDLVPIYVKFLEEIFTEAYKALDEEDDAVFDYVPNPQDHSESEEVISESLREKTSIDSLIDKEEDETNVNERDIANYTESANTSSLCANQQTHSEITTGNTPAPEIEEKEVPESTPVSDKATSSNKYDIDKAVEALNKQAEPGSIAKCASYVGEAIEAGGLSTTGRPVPAKDYKIFLPTLGFTQIDTTNYTPIKGDIAVFEAFQGATKYYEYGHVQIYNGTQWVSDFKQSDFWAGPEYRTYKPDYTIFRWE